jgi:hypothetical protein
MAALSMSAAISFARYSALFSMTLAALACPTHGCHYYLFTGVDLLRGKLSSSRFDE